MEKPALLLTRPLSSAVQFCAQLDAGVMVDVEVVISPLLDIVPTCTAVDLSGYAGVIFTSAYAPPCVMNGGGRTAYCVGTRTAQAAQIRGWHVAFIAETADGLIAQMETVRGPLLHLAGQHRRGEIADRLRHAGVQAQVVVVYCQPAQKLSAQAYKLLSETDVIVAPIFSPRSAELFVEQVKVFENVHIVAISGAVATEFGAVIPNRLCIAPAPTGEEMRRCVEMLLRDTTLP